MRDKRQSELKEILRCNGKLTTRRRQEKSSSNEKKNASQKQKEEEERGKNHGKAKGGCEELAGQRRKTRWWAQENARGLAAEEAAASKSEGLKAKEAFRKI